MVGIGKSATVSIFCHSGALNAPPVVLCASTASNLAVDSCCVCASVRVYMSLLHINTCTYHLRLHVCIHVPIYNGIY